MNISRQIFLSFVVILGIVIVGFVMSLRLVFKMAAAQERVNSEWSELNRMVEVQTMVLQINDEIDRVPDRQIDNPELIGRVSLLQDKIHRLFPDGFEDDDSFSNHRQQEQEHIDNFVSSMDHFMGVFSVSPVNISRWAPDVDAEMRESLSKAQFAAYQLQRADMSEMMEATRQAERLRRGIVRWSLGIFIVLVLTIVAFSLWFVWIFRRKTDILIRDQQLLTATMMSQSLAHEIRNPLSIIKSSTSVLRHKLESDAEGKELLDYLVDEVDRIDDLLKQLSRLSEESTIYQMENISVMVSSVCVVMKPYADKAGIEIVYRDQSNGVRVPCHLNQIKQVVMNLVLNAIQASSPGMKVVVETVLDKGMYRLSIKDTGSGIDPKVMKRLFEPFLTTKTHGVGLGLVVVKRIVDWHKGRVHVSSVPGQGTTFDVYLLKDSDGT